MSNEDNAPCIEIISFLDDIHGTSRMQGGEILVALLIYKKDEIEVDDNKITVPGFIVVHQLWEIVKRVLKSKEASKLLGLVKYIRSATERETISGLYGVRSSVKYGDIFPSKGV